MFLAQGFSTFKRIAVVAVVAAIVSVMLPSSIVRAADNYVGSAMRPNGDGYWLTTATGFVTASPGAPFHGDLRRASLNRPVVAMAATKTGNGYWLVASDGGIFSFGDAAFYGSTGAIQLNKPIVGMTATPSGRGYWMVASDGGIFSFGDAAFYGSTGAIRLNKPVVGMSAAADGLGYWLVATDGGIFSFGSSRFFGSTGALDLNQPIVGMTTTANGSGYWLAGADGGVFSFGDAQFRGATADGDAARAIAILRDSNGGYSLIRADGSVDQRAVGVAVGTPAVTPGAEAAAPTTSVPPVIGSPTTTSPVVSSPPTTVPSPISTAPTTTAPTGHPLGWVLKAQDDFYGTALASRWAVYDGAGTAGIGIRRPYVVSVSDGAMHINARDLVTGGICWCLGGEGSQTYGKWEIRARMDNGKGYGPAILLWPDSERWPIDGEIDIAEMSEPYRNQTHFTLHWGANNSQIQHTEVGDFTQWHTYGVDWQPGYIKYYLDGVLKYTNVMPAAIPTNPMHLALQVDAGDGRWMNAPDPGVTSGLHVDWVKMYLP